MKVKAVSPKHNSDKMLHLWMNFQKLFDQNPQSDFFRVWTSFMGVDKDFWKSKLFLQNTSLTKCYICEWIFKKKFDQNPQSDFFWVRTSLTLEQLLSEMNCYCVFWELTMGFLSYMFFRCFDINLETAIVINVIMKQLLFKIKWLCAFYEKLWCFPPSCF